ncbi:copper resistance protein CopC [Dactylosporangium sp. NBC_01737]|uniref:copper resistance CopC family protein n=1 Tax=Dactylosporangium sp. NBC_01737 TaxID=2975959 RepID=UPI002E0FE390|nr:copper resistance protein CopC [Dactylosporangium sp. NBC_01737]
MTGRFVGVVRRSSVLAAIIVGILGILPFPSIATAYAPRLTLASSTPGAETRVGHLPQELQLVFNDKILDAQVTLTGPDSATVPLGTVTVRNETARITLGVPDGAPGSYTVSYTASGMSMAGNGSFSFTVTTGVKSSSSAKPGRTPTSPPATQAPATSAAAAPADFVTSNAAPPVAEAPAPAGRPAWWTYAAVLLVVACVLVVFLGFSRRRIRPANPAK